MAKLQLDLNAQAYLGSKKVTSQSGQEVICISFDAFQLYVSANDMGRIMTDVCDIEVGPDPAAG